ncbi:MAG: DUF4125 family protein [Bifidobacteriaceae bacterium]|nr:DUF4125 family protein [Bifidobacteriaceae bacterium]
MMNNQHTFPKALIEVCKSIIELEWNQFQNTQNEGGRAECQSNWMMFRRMRLSQFLAWPFTLLQSYEDDLISANHVGRNLVTEKYARMMQSTAPEIFHTKIEPYIPSLSPERIAQQENIISIQVRWMEDFSKDQPEIAKNMRYIHSLEDNTQNTSFETYLRGELGTYSQSTLDLYERMINTYVNKHRNLTAEIVNNTLNYVDNILQQ